jgi:glycosyltransferase involved in cell wall biosynthesis
MSKNKPRILFIVPLPPPVHGSSVVSEQIRKSPKVREMFEGDFVNLSTSRRMEEIDRWSTAKIFRFASSFFGTLWKLMWHRYDVCYLAITCHGRGLLKDAPFVLLCKLFGQRVVIHQHNKGMKGDVTKPFYRFVLRMVYRHTTVVLLSEQLYPDVMDIVKKEQVAVCPNGLPLEPVPVKVEGGERCRLLFLSNMMVEKGVWTLLDACKILKENGMQFECRFVGRWSDISEQMFAEKVKSLELEDCVSALGARYGEEKEKIWTETDVFVCPTYNDCFPLVLLEAMEHAIACVATREGGIPDIVEDGSTGLLCAPHQSSALAERISVLMNDEALRLSMGKSGRKRFERLFTSTTWEERLTEILQTAAENK